MSNKFSTAIFSEILDSLVEGSKIAVTDDLADLCLMTASRVLPETVVNTMLSSPVSAGLVKAVGAAVLLLVVSSPSANRLPPSVRDSIVNATHRILMAQGINLTRELTASIDPILDQAANLFGGSAIASDEVDSDLQDGEEEATIKPKKTVRPSRSKTKITNA
jgi:hypothetical protein